MPSIFAHTILLGLSCLKRPTLKAYPSQFLFAQCREIVDTANALDGSLGACVHVVYSGWVHVGEPPALIQVMNRGEKCDIFLSRDIRTIRDNQE